MVRRSRPGASFRALLLCLSLAGLCAALPHAGSPALAQAASAQTPPPGPQAGSGGTMPMDLTTGKTDNTPLSVHSDEAFNPMSPPQTVEGTLVSVAPDGAQMVVRTKENGDVHIGLPPDVVVSREGKDSDIGAMHPGDRVYATVETAQGVRAIRLVSEPPANPLVNIIGIPLLLLIAFFIWWTGRKQGKVLAEPPTQAKKPA